MATFTQIRDRVRENVLFLNAAVLGRIEGWIQDAQEEAEDRFGWTAMKFFYQGDGTNNTGETTEGSTLLTTLANIETSLNPGAFGELLRVANAKPYYIVGDTGDFVEMEWLHTEDELFHAYPGTPDSVAPIRESAETGRPKYLYLKERFEFAIETKQFEVFPASDKANTIGDFSAAGEYRVRFHFYRRYAKLSESNNTNYFSENHALFLEHWASFRAFLFNRDSAAANAALAMAEQRMRRDLRTEKLKQIGDRLTIYPRSSYFGNRFTGRA